MTYWAVVKPSGFLDCQFQESRHMSSMLYCAFQPISCSALVASHQLAAMSPARRGQIWYGSSLPQAFSKA